MTTILALPERWTFAGTSLRTPAVMVTASPAANEFPAFRGTDPPLTGLHGRQWLPKVYDSRRIPLTILVTSLSDTGVDGGETQARTNLDSLYALFATGAQGLLAELMPDGTTRDASAQVVSVNSFAEPAGHSAFVMVVQFDLADPFMYGAAAGPGAQATTSSPKDFTATVAGVAPTRRMTIDFLGPQTNPRLTHLDTGAFVDVSVVVASAKHLIIDPYAWTALNDGVDVAASDLTNGASVEWMALLVGANHLRATNTSAGGSVTVLARPAYI